jgi:hypothetical protein
VRLEGEGFALEVPAGWDARIEGRDAPALVRGRTGELVAQDAGASTRTAVLQVASFAMPAEVGDFGGGAVDLMTRTDMLVVLFEFGPESVGQPLFEAEGLPSLRAADFDPWTCRKTIRGQSAVQRFFSLNGRPMCLYVVLGSHARRIGTTPVVNSLLSSLSVAPR